MQSLVDFGARWSWPHNLSWATGSLTGLDRFYARIIVIFMLDLRSDHMTTIACFVGCGSSKNFSLLIIVTQVFEWADMSNVTVPADHMKGCDNVVADEESRVIFLILNGH